MKFAAVALAAGLAFAGAAQAQSHDHGGHGAHGAHGGHATQGAQGASAQGQGLVKSVDARAGSVTIAHEPIKALDWGAMTMPFKVDPGLLKGIAAGDKVSFTVKGQQITAIRKQ